MKSKVTKLYNLEELRFADDLLEVTYRDHEALYQEDLKEIQKMFSVKKERGPEEALLEGDVVVISIKADDASNKKFNKEKVSLVLGKHFYDKNIETEILKKKVGDSFSCQTADGKLTVKLVINEATYMDIPPVTIEMVRESGYSDSVTMEDFRRQEHEVFRAIDRENHVADHLLGPARDLLTKESTFAIDQEELAKFQDFWLEDARNLPEELGEDFVSYIQGATGAQTEDEAELEKIYRNHLKEVYHYRLVLFELGKASPVPGREEMEAQLAEARELGIDVDSEEFKGRFTYERFYEDMQVASGEAYLFSLLEGHLKN